MDKIEETLKRLMEYNGITSEKKPDISAKLAQIAADIDYIAMMCDVGMEGDDDE